MMPFAQAQLTLPLHNPASMSAKMMSRPTGSAASQHLQAITYYLFAALVTVTQQTAWHLLLHIAVSDTAGALTLTASRRSCSCGK